MAEKVGYFKWGKAAAGYRLVSAEKPEKHKIYRSRGSRDNQQSLTTRQQGGHKMAHNARVEELSDSDPEDMDPSDFDPSMEAPAQSSIISPSNIPSKARPQGPPSATQRPDPELVKEWQCLYPLYFDSTKSRAEGRRVGKELAVKNPLAREVCDAVFGLGLELAFEAGKIHPKDWANPGRVRVLVKQNGKAVSRNVRNSTSRKLDPTAHRASQNGFLTGRRTSPIHQSGRISPSTPS